MPEDTRLIGPLPTRTLEELMLCLIERKAWELQKKKKRFQIQWRSNW